ncbi:MAG: PQQ-binding-like beta-propeller repeat protein [Sedimentisphaerales bacterium]|nr:PQQ-binding-like beta-propeller repeat protein [Sedimentisphaerales bacterium]
MLKKVRFRIVLLVSVSTLWITHNSLAGQSSSKPLISQELLKHARLKMLWDNELPIKKNENLDRLLLFDNRLYIVSDRNFMLSLDQKSGEIIFGKAIEAAGLPVTGVKLYDNELMYISSSSKLVQMNAQSGNVLKTTDISFSASCPVARNSTYFYIAGTDNRLHAIHAGYKVQAFEVAAENESMITSVTAGESSVIFATAAGNIISIAPDMPRRLWQFDASKAIAGEVITDGMSMFFASRDTNVYRVDMVGLPEKKRLIWKHQTAAILEDAPVVTRGIVYQHVKDKGLTAINKDTGSALWRVPGGIDLLTEAKNKAYVITNTKTLVVMDNIKAKKLYTVNITGVTKHASNVTDDKIYIADNTGRIACLRPVE